MVPRDLSHPLKQVSYLVRPDEEGMRLDQWLQGRVHWRSRTDLQRRIATGGVRVDGKAARKSARISTGQVVTVAIEGGPATEEVPVADIPIVVLQEDRHLIVLDKAPGSVVHPVGRHVMDTVINALHARHNRGEGVPGSEAPMIVHRLDRDTSGVLLLAKDEQVRKALGRDFEARRVSKSYVAIVQGSMERNTGSIDLPIGPAPDASSRVEVACVPDGRPSLTEYVVLARSQDFTLVRCLPLTGRQHQIRVHLAAAGHPILCDRLYGDPADVTTGSLGLLEDSGDQLLLGRQALHAESLTFVHPVTQERIRVEAPLTEDIQTFVRLCPGMCFVGGL